MDSEIEVRRARKQNIDYVKQHHTPHCWLPAKVMYPANSTKRLSWLALSAPICIVDERSNILYYVLTLEHTDKANNCK